MSLDVGFYVDIMNHMDLDKTGKVNYTAFLLATIDMKELTVQENLWAAFKHFDLVPST